MDVERFHRALDRFGAVFSNWPLGEARKARRLVSGSDEARDAFALVRRIEAEIGASRPAITRDRAQMIVSRAMAEVARREMRPTLGRALQMTLMDPFMRTAFVLSLTAIGFAIGTAIGSPDLVHSRDMTDGPFVATTADDAAF